MSELICLQRPYPGRGTRSEWAAILNRREVSGGDIGRLNTFKMYSRRARRGICEKANGEVPVGWKLERDRIIEDLSPSG